MFRCDNCGSGYSAQAAGSWSCCPRCMAKDRVQVPLTFELGWRRPAPEREAPARPERDAPRQPSLR
ncbi:MAG TPA: hypothetical protein VFN92_00085 [Solirubrobacterales bacterium]|nr:hypothetical protein [Solirubrobacterales bacterium]